MGNLKRIKRFKILFVPYPAQGHVIPMRMLASALLSRGFEPVMIIPEFIHSKNLPAIDPNDKISYMTIPDSLETDVPRDFFSIEKAIENTLPIHLERLIHKFDDVGSVACVIVDLLVSSAIDVARRCGVPVAGFWPAMLAVYNLIAAIPHMVKTGFVSDTGSPLQTGPLSLLPNQPLLSSDELPWLIGTQASREARFKFWTRTMERSRNIKWLLVNSFPEDCINDDQAQICDGLLKYSIDHQPVVLQVGPLCNQAMIKNPSLWEEDMSCLQWLDKQKPDSVIYISFGSWVRPIGEGNVKNLALALEAIGKPFIWVLRQSWREGLPSGYMQRVSKQGKVVSWAPQLQVLKHKAVGCYLTHCGWNSTMEAIHCKKRMLCYPVAGDQFVNCAFIVKKWKIGVKINGFEKKNVEEGLRRVIEYDKMDNRLDKVYEKTMGEEASSKAVSRLTGFVDDLFKLTNQFRI